MKRAISAALLTSLLIVTSGCDQVETSGKQLLDSAANSARQAVDDTHKAAIEALEQAREELSVAPPADKPAAANDKPRQDI